MLTEFIAFLSSYKIPPFHFSRSSTRLHRHVGIHRPGKEGQTCRKVSWKQNLEPRSFIEKMWRTRCRSGCSCTRRGRGQARDYRPRVKNRGTRGVSTTVWGSGGRKNEITKKVPKVIRGKPEAERTVSPPLIVYYMSLMATKHRRARIERAGDIYAPARGPNSHVYPSPQFTLVCASRFSSYAPIRAAHQAFTLTTKAEGRER